MKTLARRPVAPERLAALPAHWHPVLRRVYAARGVADATGVDYALTGLLDYAALSNIDAAAELLAEHIRRGRRLLIVADFDADGATACALAVRGLRALGAADVRHLVPNRFQHGYGLTPEVVQLAAAQRPDLLITVDNGISSLAGVAAARALGIPVLVTDHHLPDSELPAAAAIVNPNLPQDAFGSKQLAGVGVMFYVLAATRARLRALGWFDAPRRSAPRLSGLLDLVALGTVADVVPLDRNNRILIEQGLQRMRAGSACAGIRALFAVAGRNPAQAACADLAFAVAPRLNAAGRLTDMSLGVACLLCDEPTEALALAQRLDALNRERRQIEAGMVAEAQTALRVALQRVGPEGAATAAAAALCLHDPSWHQGLIGLVAGRIKEISGRPVIAFAAGAAGELKGSARSVTGLNIRDAIAAVAVRLPQAVLRFGGHAMAAGLAIRADSLDAFAQALDAEVRGRQSAEDRSPALWSDGELAAADLGGALAQALRSGGPWGSGFPEPQFDGVFEVAQTRVIAEQHLRLWLRPAAGAEPIEAMAFRQAERAPRSGQQLRLAYQLEPAPSARGARLIATLL